MTFVFSCWKPGWPLPVEHVVCVDVGFPSVCCEYVYYHWLIKMLIWLMARQNIARQGIQRDGGKKRRVWKLQAVTREARCEITSHEPVVKYKLVEMG